MRHLVPITTRFLAPGAILAAGLVLMMGAPTDALVTALRIVAGVIALPVALVVAAYVVQAWWQRRVDARSSMLQSWDDTTRSPSVPSTR